jgi:hypothetical protein
MLVIGEPSHVAKNLISIFGDTFIVGADGHLTSLCFSKQPATSLRRQLNAPKSVLARAPQGRRLASVGVPQKNTRHFVRLRGVAAAGGHISGEPLATRHDGGAVRPVYTGLARHCEVVPSTVVRGAGAIVVARGLQ